LTAPVKTIRSATDLAARGLIAAGDFAAIEEVARRYAVAITPEMAELIDPTDPRDPIALQFTPDARELNVAPGERADPIGDQVHSPVEGIVHRYPDRVLLKPLHICPVYCRFCFRREFVGPDGAGALSNEALALAIDYIGRDENIWEVILTGGDPLAMSPRRLGDIARRLRDIPHVKILRVHTRVPVVDPASINDEMILALKSFGRSVYVALHANHPRELTPRAREACARLIDAGIPMVSQSVLLKGVNDNVETLSALMRAFVETRVKPYYLHHPDLAPGTAHLRVGIEEGRALARALLGRVSGLCQPAYVLDIPGGHGKSPIGPDYLRPASEGGWVATDYRGIEHAYPPTRDKLD
jgi:lysine 2,3-aminomutase